MKRLSSRQGLKTVKKTSSACCNCIIKVVLSCFCSMPRSTDISTVEIFDLCLVYSASLVVDSTYHRRRQWPLHKHFLLCTKYRCQKHTLNVSGQGQCTWRFSSVQNDMMESVPSLLNGLYIFSVSVLKVRLISPNRAGDIGASLYLMRDWSLTWNALYSDSRWPPSFRTTLRITYIEILQFQNDIIWPVSIKPNPTPDLE